MVHSLHGGCQGPALSPLPILIAFVNAMEVPESSIWIMVALLFVIMMLTSFILGILVEKLYLKPRRQATTEPKASEKVIGGL
jgi:hypothetical protein